MANSRFLNRGLNTIHFSNNLDEMVKKLLKKSNKRKLNVQNRLGKNL